ncbi:hypothetical protein BJ912DRAFT_1066001 [Pholiota molesta]|nr:hypothetical protein BJ912DRAFT_1066001 [Pholiota molesta]
MATDTDFLASPILFQPPAALAARHTHRRPATTSARRPSRHDHDLRLEALDQRSRGVGPSRIWQCFSGSTLTHQARSRLEAGAEEI